MTQSASNWSPAEHARQRRTLSNGKPSECQDSSTSTTGHSVMGWCSVTASPNTSTSNSPNACSRSTMACIGLDRAFFSIAQMPITMRGSDVSESARLGSCGARPASGERAACLAARAAPGHAAPWTFLAACSASCYYPHYPESAQGGKTVIE